MRDLAPINPAADLGSESLDAPIEDKSAEETVPVEAEATSGEPTLGELAQRGFEMEAPEEFDEKPEDGGNHVFTRKHFKNALIESCESATCEPAAGHEPAESQEPQRADTGFASLSAEQISAQRKPLVDKRDALDLDSFSALPDPSVEAKEEAGLGESAQIHDAAPEPKPAPTPASALEVLRKKPTGELSLVEMVERFAAALHERQAQERARFENTQQSRDAALAEALKALTLFTENGFDAAADRPRAASPTPASIDQTEEELRSALTRLQGLRGAA